MATVFRVVVNGRGIREILRSQEVRAELERRARKVAAAANADPTIHGGDPLDYRVHSEIGKRRARAAVTTAGRRTQAHELYHHTLARAIDHAR